MDIGNVSEIIGTIAVVASVGYLAIQIQRGTAESKLAATRDLFQQVHEAMAACTLDDRITEIYLLGVRDPGKLNYQDRFRFSALCYRMFAVIEQQFFHLRENSIHSSYFVSQSNGFDSLLQLPGVRKWWVSSESLFHSEFCVTRQVNY